MSTTPTTPGANTAPTLLWVNYILLILFTFSFISSILSWLGLVAFLVAFFVRRSAASQGLDLGVAHATWQINTVFIALAVCMLGIGCAMGVFYWMGSTPEVEAQLNAISSATNTPPLELFQQLWAIPGIKSLVVVVLVSMGLFLIWPLKRALQGILALRAGIAPSAAGAATWIALGLAIVIQAVALYLPVALS